MFMVMLGQEEEPPASLAAEAARDHGAAGRVFHSGDYVTVLLLVVGHCEGLLTLMLLELTIQTVDLSLNMTDLH
jgi:hypothetical protein